MTKHKVLEDELEHYQPFLLHIDKEGFNQGLCQTAYFHDILVDDDRYIDSKNVVVLSD